MDLGRNLSQPRSKTRVGGGVAVCLHGYQRNTTDLDLVIRSEDRESVRRIMTEAGFAWDTEKAEIRSEDGIAIQFLIAGQKAGKGTEILVPEPVGDLNVEQIEGLAVVRLSRLIELKIALPNISPACSQRLGLG